MTAAAARRCLSVLAVALVLAASACSSTAGPAGALLPSVDDPVTPVFGGSATATPAPSTPPARPTTPVVDRGDVLAVYRAWWTAVQEAFARGDATDADLMRYGVDPILTKERNQIRALRTQGIVQRTQLTLSPRLLHRDGAVAEVVDCVRGPAGTYYDLASGRPRAPRGYRNDVATQDALLVSLHKRGATWFVVAATSRGVQPC